mmetsp:Transcript_7466/g.19556  ORF Transcript_7466/g.19556 Transcript_7466/m.19556 type:complete len:413 (-) Transcript_7466:2819-4057(-)
MDQVVLESIRHLLRLVIRQRPVSIHRKLVLVLSNRQPQRHHLHPRVRPARQQRPHLRPPIERSLQEDVEPARGPLEGDHPRVGHEPLAGLRRGGAQLLLNFRRPCVDSVAQPVELAGPRPCDVRDVDGRVIRRLSQLLVVLRVLENFQGALHGPNKVAVVVVLEIEAVALTGLRVPLVYRVFQTAGFESHHGGPSDKELLLDDTAGLKRAGHDPKVRAEVAQRPVREKLIRSRPKLVTEPPTQVVHAPRTVGRVLVGVVGGAAEEDLDLAARKMHELLHGIQDHVHALLRRNAPHESEQGDRVVGVLEVEVFLLQLLLRFFMGAAGLVAQKLLALLLPDAVGIRKRRLGDVQQVLERMNRLKLLQIRRTDRSPSVRAEERAPARIDDHLRPPRIHQQVSREPMDVVKRAITL